MINIDTPRNKRPIKPIKLFKEINDRHLSYKERNMKFKINDDIEDMNLQVILMNTQTITASKFQEMVEACLKCKDHSSIFCFTEIKCDSLNFKPVGIKLFTKHRKSKEKKGGGLLIGFKDDKKINMVELKTTSNDILALEGT